MTTGHRIQCDLLPLRDHGGQPADAMTIGHRIQCDPLARRHGEDCGFTR